MKFGAKAHNVGSRLQDFRPLGNRVLRVRGVWG